MSSSPAMRAARDPNFATGELRSAKRRPRENASGDLEIEFDVANDMRVGGIRTNADEAIGIAGSLRSDLEFHSPGHL